MLKSIAKRSQKARNGAVAKVKPKKVKINSVSYKKAKAKAWTEFSLWVRLSAANSRGYAACVTCGAIKHYKRLQAGHFVPGRGNAILFDERGVHPQCFGCNIFKHGNPRMYNRWMKKHYGQAVIDELDDLSLTSRKYTIPDLVKLSTYYHDLTVQLLKKVYS